MIDISYTIIGDGPKNESDELKELIEKLNLKEFVTIIGKLLHCQLKEYFDRSNIGVSYIPLRTYFDKQPPTKTFEYLLSGMPVIATKTTANSKIINPETGVLIGDRPIDFHEGLITLYRNRNHYDSQKIRKLNLKHTWENIVRNNLKVYLDGLYP
jgi:glycosyltransferase involved in cell wall biosynthesis